MKLIAPEGRIIVSVDLESKNFTTFENGTVIRLERDYNNLNRRYVAPVNAIVISAENIPEGSEILIGHNAVHDVNRIFNYNKLSGSTESSSIKYYSLRERECFLYRELSEDIWHPCKGFVTALRIFKPYEGIISNVEHSLIKNKLYITNGELKGNVVCVLKASDYELIFNERNGREKRIIRLRHFEGDNLEEREEILCIDHHLTELVNERKYLLGLTSSDAKILNELV